jgi:chromosomal replication initiator protein
MTSEDINESVEDNLAENGDIFSADNNDDSLTPVIEKPRKSLFFLVEDDDLASQNQLDSKHKDGAVTASSSEGGGVRGGVIDLTAQSAVSILWEQCRKNLRSQLDAHVFAAYIEPLVVVNEESSLSEPVTVSLHAPNSFLRSYVERYLRDHIVRELLASCSVLNISPNSVNLILNLALAEKTPSEKRGGAAPFVVVKKIPTHVPTPRQDALSSKSDSAIAESLKPIAVGLNPRYTFSNFVVGNSNQFCHAAALRVAESPGHSYNPLFVYGGVGLGKTHLLHAIGNFYLERNPQGRVAYMSSETFTNELILALRHARMEEFKNRMRNIEVLLIDDIQFMRGKERTQEEFFHTFNALYNAKHQIVITSDKIPSDIPGLEERLQTRFSWGLTADLQAPDFETRVAILNRKAALDKISLPESVSHYIAENISSNVRELEGALTRLNAISSLQNVSLSISLAESALKPLLQPRTVNVSVEDIKKAVALHFGIKVSEMVSKRRTKNLSFPRHVAMYMCRKHTTASYPEIGADFGGRDHSSVIHAANVVAGKIKKDSVLARAIESIEKSLQGR